MEKLIILILVVFCCFLNLATYAPPVSFYLDIVTNLQGYLLIFQILLIATLTYRFFKSKKIFLLVSLTILVLLSFRIFSEIKNFYFYSQQALSSNQQAQLNLYFANINSLDTIQKLQEQILETNANLVIIKNNNLDISPILKLELGNTMTISSLGFRNKEYEVIIFSAFPLEVTDQTFELKDELPSYLIANLKFDQKYSTKLIFWSALNPLVENNFHANKAYCRRLATMVKNQAEPFLVVGNFQATPFSQCYRWFASEKRTATDSLWGKGFVPTWKANNPLLNLKLDHIFYNQFWNIQKSAIHPSLDRSHYPQSASFAFNHNFSNSSLDSPDKSLPTIDSIN